MLKKLFVVFAMLYAAIAFAAVDVNKATAAELDAVKGIGPGISGKILDERKKGPFKDWDDMIKRVNGVGETNAAKFSAEGMTVGGSSFKGVAATPTPAAAKKDDKPAAKDAKDSKPTAASAAAPAAAPAKDAKATDAKPAAAAAPAADAKTDPKAEAKAKKDADKKAKDEAKAKAAEEKKAKADADKKAKADAKPAAKAADAKPAAAKDAASAAKK